MASDTNQERQEPIPSGRFVLRIDPGLHRALRETARKEGLSLNDLCVRRLAQPDSMLPSAARGAVAKALDVMGNDLLGVVAFGSWAREELAADSDLDVLVVVDGGVELGRTLYRRWDEVPLAWQGHPMEPHFAHLPGPESRLSGFWAEVALDGLVLFDRDLSVQRSLAALRRRIASGEVERRELHGHSYWVEVA